MGNMLGMVAGCKTPLSMVVLACDALQATGRVS